MNCNKTIETKFAKREYFIRRLMTMNERWDEWTSWTSIAWKLTSLTRLATTKIPLHHHYPENFTHNVYKQVRRTTEQLVRVGKPLKSIQPRKINRVIIIIYYQLIIVCTCAIKFEFWVGKWLRWAEACRWWEGMISPLFSSPFCLSEDANLRSYRWQNYANESRLKSHAKASSSSFSSSTSNTCSCIVSKLVFHYNNFLDHPMWYRRL